MPKFMETEFDSFINHLNSSNESNASKSIMATKVLYKSFSRVNRRLANSGRVLEIDESAPMIKTLLSKVSSIGLSDIDYKKWSLKCINEFPIFQSINQELYNLIIHLLDLKITDSLMHINAIDESFLFTANNYMNKRDYLRLKTSYYPDNDLTADIIQMRLELNSMNYTRIDSLGEIVKIKPNKIFISPGYDLLDKDFIYHNNNNFWETVIQITKLLNERSKVVVLVPNTMLSRNSDQEFRETLLKSNTIEAIISLPLRYYSSNLNVDVSLLILRKKSGQIKILDTASRFNNSDIKSAGLENITKYIFEELKESSESIIDFNGLITKNSNLLISNIVNQKTYSGLADLIQLKNVAKVTKGYKGTKTDFINLESATDTEYVIVQTSDISDGQIDYETLINIYNGLKYKKYIVKKNDVLITNKSSKSKIAVVDDSKKILIATCSMLVISPDICKLNPYYLQLFLESEKGQSILSTIRKGDKTNTITIGDLENIYVPCPPINIQLEKINGYINLLSSIKQKRKDIIEIKNSIKNLIDEQWRQ